VSALIISDLKYAYSTLPDRNSYEISMVKQNILQGQCWLKMYLYLASCAENNVGKELEFSLNSFDWVNANEYYLDALNVSKDIYENSGYVLHPEYKYLFIADNSTLKSEQAKEAIMIATFGQKAKKILRI